MSRASVLLALFLLGPAAASAQADSTLAQDGLYDRPFIASLSSTSLGGYVEGNTNWFMEDGVSEGFSMELRRFNIFLFSQISERVRFLAELEFEHGTEEIALETAIVDVLVRPSLVLRGGIILPPIGYLNQNHDSPKWDFVERPLVTTTLVPSTLSEVGFGVYGKGATRFALLSWDLYVTNGLGAGVVGNAEGRTDIASGKSEEAFGEDNNGSPAVSGRFAARVPGRGEVGLSFYGGYYNDFRLEGEDVDERRALAMAALDVGVSLGSAEVRGEWAFAAVDVPDGLNELYGGRQWGGHLDFVLPVLRPQALGYDNAVVSVLLRVEHVDYNLGTFASTGATIRDDVTALVPGLSYRPSAGTVLRANYRYEWRRDFPGNAAVRAAGIQVGFATYF